jgi:hypothetical protein
VKIIQLTKKVAAATARSVVRLRCPRCRSLSVFEPANVGGEQAIVDRGWTPSRKRLDLLFQTANFYRHEKATVAEPANPIDFNEAKRLVSRIVREWTDGAARDTSSS